MSAQWKVIKTSLERLDRVQSTEFALNDLAKQDWDVVELIQEQGYVYIIAKKPAN
jgi:hypothetical protein